MNKGTERGEQNKTWENALIAAYFFILFFGLRSALENYLLEDTLPIALTMLLGFFAAIITTVMVFIIMGKGLKAKAVGAVVLLILMVITNLLVA